MKLLNSVFGLQVLNEIGQMFSLLFRWWHNVARKSRSVNISSMPRLSYIITVEPASQPADHLPVRV